MDAQVANAPRASATLKNVDQDQIKAHRIARLKALIDSFGGNLSAVGRALGYQDGVFVRQMRDGVRAISEKTIHKIEALPGRAGWFSSSAVAAEPAAEPAHADLLAAIELIAAQLADADDMARDAAAPILAKLAHSPGEAARAAQMLERVLGVTTAPPTTESANVPIESKQEAPKQQPARERTAAEKEATRQALLNMDESRKRRAAEKQRRSK